MSVFIDDILISCGTEAKHLESLEEVLMSLASVGLSVKRSKCKFLVLSIEFLGHLIDGMGIHPLPDKIQVIQQAPTPTNLTELKSYIGLLSYYCKFLPHLSTCLAPLYRLLRKDAIWQWTSEQEAAFSKSKELLISLPLLVHYRAVGSSPGVGRLTDQNGEAVEGSEIEVRSADHTARSGENFFCLHFQLSGWVLVALSYFNLRLGSVAFNLFAAIDLELCQLWP